MHDEDLIELETLYRTAPVGLCLVDRDLRYVRINERLAAINGKPPGEHIGRTIREIIPEMASRIEPFYRRVFESGEPILDVETSGTLQAEPEVERSWRCSYYPIKSPDGMVERVSVVVEDITIPKRAKRLLEERLQFETLLSSISATFINLPDSVLDQEIEQGLERIAETLNIDRVILFEISEDKTRFMITYIHEHCGGLPFPGFVASNLSPWILEKICRGEAVALSRCPDDLPEEAIQERQYCLQRGLKSHLTIPLKVGGSILGAMVFGSYSRYIAWSGDLIERLRITGEVFANAMVRKRAEEALKVERQRLFNLLDELPAFVAIKAPDYSLRYANRLCREAFGIPQGERCYELMGREGPCDECGQIRVLETGELTNHEWTWIKTGRSFQVFHYPFAEVNGSPQVLSLGFDITEHKQAEEALRKSKESYQSLAGQLLNAQEADRRWLALELHDDLTQRLAASAIEASMLEHQHQSSQGAIAGRLKEMKDKIEELCKDTQAISRRLHPSVLDDLGLADAVHSECTSFAQQQGIVVNYESENIPQGLPPDIALYIYRIIQEGLRNIARHARATEVDISLVGKDDAIHLFLKDNGIGFNPLKVKKGRLGLVSMKERVNLAHGDFSIQSQPGQGTVIEVLVPLSRSPLHEPHPDIAGR
ncbi:MAG: PAS domain-containing protein [Desulfobaccales bacterium]